MQHGLLWKDDQIESESISFGSIDSKDEHIESCVFSQYCKSITENIQRKYGCFWLVQYSNALYKSLYDDHRWILDSKGWILIRIPFKLHLLEEYNEFDWWVKIHIPFNSLKHLPIIELDFLRLHEQTKVYLHLYRVPLTVLNMIITIL